MKKALAILALTLALVIALPTVGFASNASTLSKLKRGGVKKYDATLPKNGASKSAKQLIASLNKLKFRPGGRGTTVYEYILDFTSNKSDERGTYACATKVKLWHKQECGTGRFWSYCEEVNMMVSGLGTSCSIYNNDNKYSNYYWWTKGKKTGTKDKRDRYSGPYNYRESNYKVYPDAKVLGQKCFVYGYDWSDSEGNSTEYCYVSRKNGVLLKRVSESSDSIRTALRFDCHLENKAASFFKPPAKVKFTQVSHDKAMSSADPCQSRGYGGLLEMRMRDVF